LNGIRCNGCSFTGSEAEFIGDLCPKCGIRVVVVKVFPGGKLYLSARETIFKGIIRGGSPGILISILVYINSESLKAASITWLICLVIGVVLTFIDQDDQV
jgi:hypothetical protein